MPMYKLTSRKLWMTIGLFVLLTTLIWFNKIDSSDYVHAIMTLFGIYSGANVITKFVNPNGGGKGDSGN